MKKKLALLFAAMVIVAVFSALITSAADLKSKSNMDKKDKISILATFYPVYMIGLNLTDQIDNIELNSLTDINTGCLHDYQLTTEDMKRIASADILIMNGGGMESFLDDITAEYPNLKIIDTSQGITMLPNDVWELGGIEVEGSVNAHVWLDPELYQKQIENVRDGIVDFIAASRNDNRELEQAVKQNAQIYLDKVKELDVKLENLKESMLKTDSADKEQVIIFHNAFAYLADRIELKIAYTVPIDEDTALSAGDIARIVDKVKTDKIRLLFTEKQFGDTIANRIEAETDAKVYIIDSAVTGDGSKNSYIDSMESNLSVIQDALLMK